MNSKFLRISICDCNNGRFIASTTKQEIEYIYNVVMKSSVKNEDWIVSSDTIEDSTKGDFLICQVEYS